MEQELNIYGDVSGGFIFDQMDRYAHKYAISYIGECVTASSDIDYFLPVKSMEDMMFSIENYYSIWTNKIKVHVSMTKVTYEPPEVTTYATASFLFIKRK